MHMCNTTGTLPKRMGGIELRMWLSQRDFVRVKAQKLGLKVRQKDLRSTMHIDGITDLNRVLRAHVCVCVCVCVGEEAWSG